MARIEGVSKSQAGPVVKLVYRFGPRAVKKLTGRDPQIGNGIEPIEIWAHQPKMMVGMGRFNQAVRKGKAVDERIKNLVELKGAQMIGCEFCVDLGSQICRNSGFSDEELLALPRYQSSDLFTDREKAALDYTAAVMRTPVEVTDDLFTRVTVVLRRAPACGDHRPADAGEPRPLQRRVRDRLGGLQRRNGMRPARPPGSCTVGGIRYPAPAVIRASRLDRAGLVSGRRPAAHVQQPLFEICPRPAPLRERGQDLLHRRELLVE